MSDNDVVCLINGVRTDNIGIGDRALHYGDGLFETFAINKGKPQLWQAHIERLLRGCAVLGLPQPDVEQLFSEATQLCQHSEQAVLKLILSRGPGGRGYRAPSHPQPCRILLRYPWPELPDWQHGVTLRLCQTPLSCHPQLSGIKHLNRLEQILARNEWQEEGIYEGLMCDPQGHVIEGTMSNLFAIHNGKLITPALSACGLPGTMRQLIITLAREAGLACEERSLQAADLAQMDELFICNSILAVMPVSRLGETCYPIEQGLQWRHRVIRHLEKS